MRWATLRDRPWSSTTRMVVAARGNDVDSRDLFDWGRRQPITVYRHDGQRCDADHISYLKRSSNLTAVSVFSSRYFTITGAYNPMPAFAPLPDFTGRVPGTTTAPAGISSGCSPSRR